MVSRSRVITSGIRATSNGLELKKDPRNTMVILSSRRKWPPCKRLPKCHGGSGYLEKDL